MKLFIVAVSLIVSLAFVSVLSAENQVAESQAKWIPIYEKQANIPDPAAMLINTDPEPDLSRGFVDLYNGKNLDGWVSYGGNCTFEARGEAILGTCVKGSPSTYLSTVRNDYADFVFTAEIKWKVDGNTGIIFRGQVRDGEKHKVVFGPQAEMEHEAKQRFWSGGIYGQSCGGWAYPLWLESHEAVRNAIKRDDWNRITIKAVGDTVKTWVNGIPAAHWKTDKFKQGFFGLQVHAGQQGTILFRDIKVNELVQQ